MLWAISSEASRMTPIQREGLLTPPDASPIDKSPDTSEENAVSASSTSQALVIAIRGVLNSWEAERMKSLSALGWTTDGRDAAPA